VVYELRVGVLVPHILIRKVDEGSGDRKGLLHFCRTITTVAHISTFTGIAARCEGGKRHKKG
jgi:hypothetical protein